LPYEKGIRMDAGDGVIVETEFISDLARKLARVVPGSGGDLDVMRADLERNFRGLLAGAFERLDLVTREEFDVQRRVLERSREKLAKLEAQVSALEQQRPGKKKQSRKKAGSKTDPKPDPKSD
jgi:BMFP domain-containing protein YqiC